MTSLAMAALKSRLAAFRDDVRGSLSVEAALVLPLLCWFYVASFVWFDAFRAQNTNLKASYTLADMLSREQAEVNAAYMQGLNRVYDYLAASGSPTYIRVTIVKCTQGCLPPSSGSYDDADVLAGRRLAIEWSYATEGRPALNNTTIASYNDKIPYMPKGDIVILLETFMTYTPLFNAGLSERTFANYIVTRPRFTPQICWESCG